MTFHYAMQIAPSYIAAGTVPLLGTLLGTLPGTLLGTLPGTLLTIPLQSSTVRHELAE